MRFRRCGRSGYKASRWHRRRRSFKCQRGGSTRTENHGTPDDAPSMPDAFERWWGTIYKENELNTIARAMGVSRARVQSRAEDLEYAARWYGLHRAGPMHSSPVSLRKKIERINKSVRRLILCLCNDTMDGSADSAIDPDVLAYLVWSPDLDRGAEDVVADATTRIRRLAEVVAATVAAKEIGARSRQGDAAIVRTGAFMAPAPYTSDWLKKDWIAAMMEIFRGISAEEPTPLMEVNGQFREEPAESFICFLAAAGAPLGIAMKPGAWRDLVGHVRDARQPK